jgi:hypothetical protein
MALIRFVLLTVRDVGRSRARLHVELLAVRHQVHVLERTRSRRVRLYTLDRWLWVWLSRVWLDWRRALVIVEPATVIAWHRRGLLLFWTWKSRHRTGRPPVPREVRDLIRTMSRTNLLWGAPRIHGELQKVGIDVSQATVAKYMIRYRRPPSQTWKTILANHVGQIMAADSFVVPAATCPLLFASGGPRSRASRYRAYRRHGPPDRRVDRATAPGGVSLGLSAALSPSGSGVHGVVANGPGDGHRRVV